MAVWGLALAYKKTMDLDEDRAKAYELEKVCCCVGLSSKQSRGRLEEGHFVFILNVQEGVMVNFTLQSVAVEELRSSEMLYQ